jgi:sugar/nucleoside kinase (ribokinase family)
MGTSLISPKVMEAMREAVRRVKARGGTISFDPNSRKELASGSELAAFVEEILSFSDIVMPSGSELRILGAESDESAAIAALLDRGVGAVVVKRGAQGATYYDQSGAIHGAPFAVEEVDPTGAGDCFGATFVVCHLLGMTVAESLRYANASGAHKVLFRGPMEGVAGFPELDAWLAGRPAA